MFCFYVSLDSSNTATLLGTDTLSNVIILYILLFFIPFRECLRIGGDSGDISFIITVKQIQTFPFGTLN